MGKAERKIEVPPDVTELQTQFGALCYRVKKGQPEILLITSRTTRRWIIPKGWPIDGCSPGETAAIEAMEEAGVEGRVGKTCLGVYKYRKYLEDKKWVPVGVAVYPLRVKDMRMRFKEADERRRKWFSPKKAARKVAEPELQALLKTFNLKTLP